MLFYSLQTLLFVYVTEVKTEHAVDCYYRRPDITLFHWWLFDISDFTEASGEENTQLAWASTEHLLSKI